MGDSDSEQMPPPSTDVEMSKEDKLNIERQEEQKLQAKYPNRPLAQGRGGGGGASLFLQNRLAKGQKFFDSGDYNMAKQRGGGVGGPGRLTMPVLAQPPTGETIPTPELVPHRKTSIIQPLHDHTQSMHLASDPAHAAAASQLHPEPGRPLPNPALTKLAS